MILLFKTKECTNRNEKGSKDNVEYEYYPTCFVVKPVGGEIKKQDTEIQEIKLFNLAELPKPLAFEHNQMVKDYVHTFE